MAHLVLLSRPLPAPSIRAGGEPIEFLHCADLKTAPAGAKVYLSTSLDQVTAALIKRLPQSVGLIANLGVGTDHIDLEAAASRGIKVSNTPVVTEDTADLAFALLLGVMRRVGANERFLRTGAWAEESPIGAMGVRVHGKTLGLVGFGAIGQAVARRAAGFGMEILYHAPSQKPDAEAATGASFVDVLDDLVAVADVISLHVPLTPQTQRLIDAALLEKFKPGSVLINTARGPVVDEQALASALASGRLGGAGLDVFEREPEVLPALKTMENVVLTPHIGSATSECRADIFRCGAANVVAFLETGSPINAVRH